MRRLTTLGLFVITVFLCQAGRGAAQEGSPEGSYQQTCSDISVKKGTLHAHCKDEKGKAHHASLAHYQNCTADIANKNGVLVCAQREGGAAVQPSGSYTQSCKDIHMRGSTLHAVCKSYDGHESPAVLRDADRCAQGVVNINGVLNCEVNDVLPPGSYLATCKDVRLVGTTSDCVLQQRQRPLAAPPSCATPTSAAATSPTRTESSAACRSEGWKSAEAGVGHRR